MAELCPIGDPRDPAAPLGFEGVPTHEYVVRTEENASLILALARHIFEHGVEGRFYSQVRKYLHEGGKVYWSMADAPEGATLINRCDEGANKAGSWLDHVRATPAGSETWIDAALELLRAKASR